MSQTLRQRIIKDPGSPELDQRSRDNDNEHALDVYKRRMRQASGFRYKVGLQPMGMVPVRLTANGKSFTVMSMFNPRTAQDYRDVIHDAKEDGQIRNPNLMVDIRNRDPRAKIGGLDRKDVLHLTGRALMINTAKGSYIFHDNGGAISEIRMYKVTQVFKGQHQNSSFGAVGGTMEFVGHVDLSNSKFRDVAVALRGGGDAELGGHRGDITIDKQSLGRRVRDAKLAKALEDLVKLHHDISKPLTSFNEPTAKQMHAAAHTTSVSAGDILRPRPDSILFPNAQPARKDAAAMPGSGGSVKPRNEYEHEVRAQYPKPQYSTPQMA